MLIFVFRFSLLLLEKCEEVFIMIMVECSVWMNFVVVVLLWVVIILVWFEL